MGFKIRYLKLKKINSSFLKENVVKNCFILLFLIGVIFLNKDFFNPLFLYPKEGGFKKEYYAVPLYLELSENASQGYGPLIVGSPDDRKIYGFGDYDPGWPILITILTYFFRVEFHKPSDFTIINTILLCFSLLCFSLLFIKKTPRIFFFTQILIMTLFFLSGKYCFFSVDYHGSFFSMAMLSFILVELFFQKKKSSPYLKLFLLSLVGGLFGMVRGYFSYLYVLLIFLFSRDILVSKRKFSLAAFLIAILVCLNFSDFVQNQFYSYTFNKYSDLPLNIKKPKEAESKNHANYDPPYRHGFWHSAYIGLGEFPNENKKEEIYYLDLFGAMSVERISPGVKIYSFKYFSIMKSLYFKYLKENPIEYIKNHILKMSASVSILKNELSNLWKFLIVSLLIFFIRFYKCRNMEFMNKNLFYINPVHCVPICLFFCPPLIASIYNISEILAYISLIIIMLIVQIIEIKPKTLYDSDMKSLHK